MLVAGGGPTYLPDEDASAELHNPNTGEWTLTGSLNVARIQHVAPLLPNGLVLVAGGTGTNGVSGILSSAELYNPSTGEWTLTGSLNDVRYDHVATLLPNGLVLVAGGENSTGGLIDAELYNPASGSWASTGSLNLKRYSTTLTLLPNGNALIVGGYAPLGTTNINTTAEIYNFNSGTWGFASPPANRETAQTATLLANGRVLLAGGQAFPGWDGGTNAELYDFSFTGGGTWTASGNLNDARCVHTETLLPNGQVLVAGGYGWLEILASAETNNPVTGIWGYTGSLNTSRVGHTATLLPNGLGKSVASMIATVFLAGSKPAKIGASKCRLICRSLIRSNRSRNWCSLLASGKDR